MRNKSVDLEELASKLDISPTMHKYAEDRYKGIAELLNKNGIDAVFYPQGSFRTGTVVRPIKDNVDSDYDIDVVCEWTEAKDSLSPKQVKQETGTVLESDGTYSEKLLPEDSRCWTLQYAEVVDGIGLKLDVVPCVKEAQSAVQQLISNGIPELYANQAVAITDKTAQDAYHWLPSNPGGYGDWFDHINEPFLQANRATEKQRIFKSYRSMFSASAKAEEVPDYYIRSPLQRSIQILKRHRDLYFSRGERFKNNRPASVVLTTLSARIADGAPVQGVEQLLSYIVLGLSEYVTLLQGKCPAPRFTGDERTIIERRGAKWWIPNPVNPADNYADSWTDLTAELFFLWVSAVKKDLVDINPDEDTKYWTSLQTAFGPAFIKKAFGAKAETGKIEVNPPISPSLQRPTKPWGCSK